LFKFRQESFVNKYDANANSLLTIPGMETVNGITNKTEIFSFGNQFFQLSPRSSELK
jgi:hypothetical protein